jgi:hypothetical protein
MNYGTNEVKNSTKSPATRRIRKRGFIKKYSRDKPGEKSRQKKVQSTIFITFLLLTSLQNGLFIESKESML